MLLFWGEKSLVGFKDKAAKPSSNRVDRLLAHCINSKTGFIKHIWQASFVNVCKLLNDLLLQLSTKMLSFFPSVVYLLNLSVVLEVFAKLSCCFNQVRCIFVLLTNAEFSELLNTS